MWSKEYECSDVFDAPVGVDVIEGVYESDISREPEFDCEKESPSYDSDVDWLVETSDVGDAVDDVVRDRSADTVLEGLLVGVELIEGVGPESDIEASTVSEFTVRDFDRVFVTVSDSSPGRWREPLFVNDGVTLGVSDGDGNAVKDCDDDLLGKVRLLVPEDPPAPRFTVALAFSETDSLTLVDADFEIWEEELIDQLWDRECVDDSDKVPSETERSAVLLGVNVDEGLRETDTDIDELGELSIVRDIEFESLVDADVSPVVVFDVVCAKELLGVRTRLSERVEEALKTDDAVGVALWDAVVVTESVFDVEMSIVVEPVGVIVRDGEAVIVCVRLPPLAVTL